MQNLSYWKFLAATWQQYWLACLLFLLLCTEGIRMIWVFHIRKPRNIEIRGKRTLIGKSITSLQALFKTGQFIENGYRESGGKPFAIPQRDRYLVCVSSREQIEELSSGSAKQLSLSGVMHDMLKPSYLVSEVSENNDNVARNVLKHKLRNKLSYFQQELCRTVEVDFLEELRGKTAGDGWTKVSLQSVSNKISLRMNNVVIFGDELANNADFFKSTFEFIRDCTITLAILGRVPHFLFRPISFATMRWSGGRRKLEDFIVAEILKRRGSTSNKNNLRVDCLQWMIDTSRNASPRSIARQVMLFMLGGSHQQPMLITFVLYNLCLRPEYIQPLRDEINSPGDDLFNTKNNAMPYLDSFIKEVARLNPLTHVTSPRKVVSPFTFKDGTHVPEGNYVCVPHLPLMTNPSVYQDPNTFDGFRFVSDDETASDSRFSHPSHDFPFWGAVKNGCPARFFVSIVIKLIVIQLLEHYDFKLANGKMKPTLSYEMLRMPSPFLSILVRKRV